MASNASVRRSTTSSLAKRHASASESAGKAALVATGAKKRPALANVTNQRNVVNPGRASGPEPSKIVRVIYDSVSLVFVSDSGVRF